MVSKEKSGSWCVSSIPHLRLTRSGLCARILHRVKYTAYISANALPLAQLGYAPALAVNFDITNPGSSSSARSTLQTRPSLGAVISLLRHRTAPPLGSDAICSLVLTSSQRRRRSFPPARTTSFTRVLKRWPTREDTLDLALWLSVT